MDLKKLEYIQRLSSDSGLEPRNLIIQKPKKKVNSTPRKRK